MRIRISVLHMSCIIFVKNTSQNHDPASSYIISYHVMFGGCLNLNSGLDKHKKLPGTSPQLAWANPLSHTPPSQPRDHLDEKLDCNLPSKDSKEICLLTPLYMGNLSRNHPATVRPGLPVNVLDQSQVKRKQQVFYQHSFLLCPYTPKPDERIGHHQ